MKLSAERTVFWILYFIIVVSSLLVALSRPPEEIYIIFIVFVGSLIVWYFILNLIFLIVRKTIQTKSVITRIERMTLVIFVIMMVACFLIIAATESPEADLYIALTAIVISSVLVYLFIKFFFWVIRKLIEKAGKTVDADMSLGCFIVWFFGVCFGLLRNKARSLKDAFKQGLSENHKGSPNESASRLQKK